ncbi:hypothetical protein CDCA_CDCA01G0244 [Cyanidium caldarium]|uniref:Uncharacterized protein n=1 Tax=Cyanidium caldarium TaxID=2771 RepID=A0AAV9IPP2_CYACA|nr:hypothetical protein CDCA_CDCA01G0244 [Cyanidium caldarium]
MNFAFPSFLQSTRYGVVGDASVENPSNEPYGFRYFVLQFRVRCTVREDEWLAVWGTLPLLHDSFHAPLPMKRLKRKKGDTEWALRVRFPKALYDGRDLQYTYCLMRRVGSGQAFEANYEVVGCEPCPLRQSILSSQILPYGFYEHDDKWGFNDFKVYPRLDSLGILVYKRNSKNAAVCAVS